uniref:Uncharacterized protein n=1 Tax=Arion vulgaris TaxID=1028688 RepID=A0A0B7A2B0_9EUPU
MDSQYVRHSLNLTVKTFFHLLHQNIFQPFNQDTWFHLNTHSSYQTISLHSQFVPISMSEHVLKSRFQKLQASPELATFKSEHFMFFVFHLFMAILIKNDRCYLTS